jgi:hypothetical protein
MGSYFYSWEQQTEQLERKVSLCESALIKHSVQLTENLKRWANARIPYVPYIEGYNHNYLRYLMENNIPFYEPKQTDFLMHKVAVMMRDNAVLQDNLTRAKRELTRHLNGMDLIIR